MLDQNLKFITILGPTASGKTDLALDLAREFDGEIVCADSRTIYRGMDIGTAKPTPEEQASVPHHLLDLVDPGETLSAGAFKQLAVAAIIDIAERGKVPFMVGGSGLYIDSVLFDYQFPAAVDEAKRETFEAMELNDLLELLAAEDPEAYDAVDQANKRRVIRALETAGQARSKTPQQRENSLTLGLQLNKDVMQQRIEKRIKKMLEKGFLDEVRQVGTTYGWDSEAMSGIGYKAFKEVVLGRATEAEAAAAFAHGDMMLVKKQLTWFRRNPDIVWLEQPDEAAALVRQFLSRG